MGPEIDMKFHQEVMEIVSYDILKFKLSPSLCFTVSRNLLVWPYFISIFSFEQFILCLKN